MFFLLKLFSLKRTGWYIMKPKQDKVPKIEFGTTHNILSGKLCCLWHESSQKPLKKLAEKLCLERKASGDPDRGWDLWQTATNRFIGRSFLRCSTTHKHSDNRFKYQQGAVYANNTGLMCYINVKVTVEGTHAPVQGSLQVFLARANLWRTINSLWQKQHDGCFVFQSCCFVFILNQPWYVFVYTINGRNM